MHSNLTTFGVWHRPGNCLYNVADIPNLYPTRAKAEEAIAELRERWAETTDENTYEVRAIAILGLDDNAFDGDASHVQQENDLLRPYEHVRAERDAVKARLDAATQSVERVQAWYDRDIEIIFERLIEEAENRNWCSEYDSIVDDLDRRTHAYLPRRANDFTVTYSVPVTVTISVTARDADAALAQAWDQLGPSHVRDAAYNEGCDWDSAQQSAEVEQD